MIGEGKKTLKHIHLAIYTAKRHLLSQMQCTVFLILYKSLQIEITQLQVLKDVLRLTDGKLPTARVQLQSTCALDGMRRFLTCANYRARW